MIEKKLVAITVNLTHEQGKILAACAEVRGVSRSEMAAIAIGNFLDEEMRQFQIMRCAIEMLEKQ